MKVWWHWPSATLHTLTVLSHDKVTSCPASVGLNWRQEKTQLPFSQILMINVSFPVNALRLSPAKRANAELATFPNCSNLWPSSVFKRSPVDEFQIITVLSVLPLAILPSIDQATAFTA